MEKLFDHLTTFKGDAYAFEAELHKLQLMPLFGNLYAVYQKAEARKAVLYVLYCYSLDSPFLFSGENLDMTKQRAVEYLGIEENMRNELVEFQFTFRTKATRRKASKEEVEEIVEEEDKVEELVASEYNVEKIITTIDAYLRYQNEPEFSNMMRLKDLYSQAALASHRMIKQGNEVNWKLKMECNAYANQLLKEIRESEERISFSNANLRPQLTELKEVKRKVMGSSVRIENVV